MVAAQARNGPKRQNDRKSPMSRLSYLLSKAAGSGRAMGGRPASREEVLAKLLIKRAAAHRAGLRELEIKLREQIAWSLPVQRGGAEARAEKQLVEQDG